METGIAKWKYVLLVVLSMIIIIAVGTYAWLTYRTNDTAMVLTIGEINNVQVTLSPYQIDTSLFPQVTYVSDKYTSVNAVNNSTAARNIRLFYKINSIDSELISSNFKYTIERSTNGTTYSVYKNGNFSSVSNGGELTILEESIPGNNTTYNYKVYLWIDGSSSGQSSMQGKSFNGELRATIAENQYQVTFDPNGGDVSVSSKVVTLGESYGDLPTPTRSGYTFKGWNGKNLINISNQNINFDGIYYINTTSTPKYILQPSLTYILSFDYTVNSNSNNIYVSVGYGNSVFEKDIKHSSNYHSGVGNMKLSFTSPESFIIDTPYVWFRLVRMGTPGSADVDVSNIQLEEGLTATTYEPYYITENTTVVQNKNHTLTAIWQKN